MNYKTQESEPEEILCPMCQGNSFGTKCKCALCGNHGVIPAEELLFLMVDDELY